MAEISLALFFVLPRVGITSSMTRRKKIQATAAKTPMSTHNQGGIRLSVAPRPEEGG
jgi:hypothetical protein